MAYEPLHHKYRPQTFSQLVGQGAIATTLANALQQRRIAPAYLFCGPRGTGKTSSARILAKSLNCISHPGPTPEPCGTCEICRAITNGSALDFVEIDAASNTGVDNIRELIERAQFAPVQCRYKVYVIDECLTGDTLVLTQEGLFRIDDPAIEGKQALSYNETSGHWEFKEVVRCLNQGERQILEIQTTHRKIRCTGNHLIRTNQGWVAAKDVSEGVRILSPALVSRDWLGGTWMTAPSASRQKVVPKSNYTQKDILSQKTSSLLSGLMTWATPSKSTPTEGAVAGSNTTISPWEPMLHGVGCQTYVSTPSPQWTTNLETVVSVRPAGVERVYDIEVEDNHNFVANGLLVHNCHMLSVAAFNALLKTLEEPPERVVFVLATTDPQRVLPTIISRCQRFDYRRIPLEDMVSHLTLIAGKESIHVDDEAVRLVAQVSQGGLRDAESLLDQLSLLEPPVTAEKVWDLVGAVPERDLLDLVRAIATDDGVTLLDQARKLMDRGREPLIVLQNLAGFYRDLLIAKTAGSRQDLVAITPPTWAEMCEFAQTLDVGLILAGQQHLRSAEVQVKNTTQPRLWLEVTLMGLLPSTLNSQTSFQPTARVAQSPAPLSSPASTQNGRVSPTPITTPVPSSEPVPASAPVESVPSPPASQAAQPPTPSDPAPVSPDINPTAPAETVSPASPASPDLAQLWQQLVAVLQPMGTRALMQQQGRLLSFSGQTARIGINSQPLFKMAQGRVANIEEAFYQVLQQKVKVSLEVAIDSSANTATDSGPPPTPEPNGTSPSPLPLERTAPPSVREEAPPTPAFIKPVEESISPPSAAVPEKKPILQPQSFADMPIESDFERAVKSFAQFFNGQVVSLEDGIAGKTAEPKRADSDDPPAYSDVPF
ncbi:MAG TPA: DNA polymerase III subunit gamma/tau [Leptolyngbyaceae cyanobacterium]